MRRALAFSLMVFGMADVAAGQSAERAGGQAVQPQRAGARPNVANRAALANRAAVEKALHQKLAQQARVELGLNQDQMMKLEDVDRRFTQQQRALDMRENQTRRGLRQALLGPPSVDQEKRVADLREQVMQMQRQHLDLIDNEQKELGGFMTNVQRVRFQGLQENFRRQLQEAMRQQAAAGRGGPPPP